MDSAAKKTVLRQFSYGLYAVTSQANGEPSVMTVNWLSQASFEPPLVMMAVEQDSHSLATIRQAGVFAVNVFDSDQRELAGAFGRMHKKVGNKLADRATRPGPATGVPLLAEVLGWLECRVTNSLPAGDHVVFLAEVVEAGVNREGAPLTMAAAGFKYSG